MPGIYLGLPVQRKVIGVLGDQHLGDQRFGGNAALDDPRWRWSLNDRALTGAAAVARPARDQDAESGWHDIEALRDILADLVESAATAGASLVLDVDDLLDPLEVGRERSTVGLARPLGRGPACLIAGMLGLGQCRLYLFESQL